MFSVQVDGSFVRHVVGSLVQLARPVDSFVHVLFCCVGHSVHASAIGSSVLGVRVDLIGSKGGNLFGYWGYVVEGDCSEG